MSEPRLRFLVVAGHALFVTASLGAALVQPRWLVAVCCLEAIALAFAVRRWPASRALRWVPPLVGSVHALVGLHFAFPELWRDVAALVRAIPAAADAPELAVTVLEVALARAGRTAILLTLVFFLVAALWARRPQMASMTLVATAVLAGVLGWAVPRKAPVTSLAGDVELGEVRVDFGRIRKSPVGRIPPLEKPAAAPDVLLIFMESVGKRNLEEHERSHPGCRFPEWRARGVFLSTLVPLASASHISQPSLLASFAGIDRIDNIVDVRLPKHGLLSMPEYFHRKGYRTVMLSGHDERWMGIERVSMRAPWDFKMHAIDFAPDHRHRNRCGSIGAFDSVVVKRFLHELAKHSSPRFGFLNLHNTHYPYALERTPGLDRTSKRLCSEFVDMPAEHVGGLADRYAAAMVEMEEHLAQVIEAHPTAVFVMTGDHGEDFVAGAEFGHAKTATATQGTTSAFLFGPGFPTMPVDESVSGLDLFPTLLGRLYPADLDSLPKGLLQGQDVLASGTFQRRGPVFSGSHGVAMEFAAIVGTTKIRYIPGRRELYSNLDDQPVPTSHPEAIAARRSLIFWLSCQQAFYGDEARLSELFYNPCFDAATNVTEEWRAARH